MKNLLILTVMVLALPSCGSESKSSDSCGDGIIDVGEACDGAALGGQLCTTRGFYSGDLSCSDECTFDESQCRDFCGDGVIQPDNESCDGAALGENTCESLGYHGGTLVCSDSCTFDLSACEGAGQCGNGVAEGPESCDGTDLAGATCESLGYYGGTLSCTSGCAFDTSDCAVQGRCGDGIVQGGYGEECDTANLNGGTCTNLGFSGGSLSCNASCRYDYFHCLKVRIWGTAQREAAGAVTVDDMGNVWVVGQTTGDMAGTNNGAYDYFITHFGPSLNHVATVQGGGTSDENTNGVVIAGNNRLYAMGHTSIPWPTDPGMDNEPFIVFYDVYNGAHDLMATGFYGTSASDKVTAGAPYLGQHMLIGGYTYGDFLGYSNAGGADCYISAYQDQLSGELWTTQWGSTGNERLIDLTLDPAGNIYATGFTEGVLPGATAVGDMDCFVTKLNSDGELQWSVQLGSSAADQCSGITTDGSGFVYVTGVTMGDTGDGLNGMTDAFVSKLDSSGSVLWTRQWGDTGQNAVYDIAQGNDGLLYAVGVTDGDMGGTGNLGGADIILSALDTDGTILWTRQFGSSGDDEGRRIHISDSGSIFIIGSTYGAMYGQSAIGDEDALLIQLNTTP